MALVGALTGLVATPILIVLDEYVIDLPAMLPSLPTWISNGWVPLAIILLLLIGYLSLIRRLFRASSCETRQSLFTLLVTSFIVLTVVGIAFRGEGMALMWPWDVLR